MKSVKHGQKDGPGARPNAVERRTPNPKWSWTKGVDPGRKFGESRGPSLNL